MGLGGLFRRLFRAGRNASYDTSLEAWGGLFEVRVLHVLDGDTVEVTHGGDVMTVRLSAIDCPEDGQPGADAATRGLLRLINNRYVYLETHGTDQYGRTVATIFAMDGTELTNVNERMVMLGHAWVSRAYWDQHSKRRQNQLNRLERWARFNKVGLWKLENPIPPWSWRKEHSRKTR